ncbi:aspartate kinase [Desulfomonile tiedjei]|uniref:Aspartokinase n=1 Tax=Desulfomonile tiedjei (strain ATCC 49306 / DSM 6799 / DCB-1) TaxID=706587 RepID=I4C7X2_DESTA|nr:aspartate kinase [Desulfomonile tiedjei]AFM25663.1 aspartate kinase [Desulfomonile tiedjei DSM 6799]
MALIVQKYGGTSVGDLDRIANVARKVAATKDKGNDVVVVVSAMSGETDRLLGLAKKISPLPNEREVDVLISTGEQVTIALLAITLESMGYKARSYCGWQIPLVTDAAYGSARVTDIKKEALLKDLQAGHIIVVAGFQGVDDAGNVTTLGRGGSDTSAVAVAAALNADLCEIFTDVDGVYTTDPNITAKARKIPKIAYEEMLEMASLGAKVLYIRAVEFAMRYKVPVVVRSSFTDNEGTLVTEENSDMEKESVRSVTCNTKEAKITISGVEDKPGIASTIFSLLADSNVVVDMIIQNSSEAGKTDISFTLPEADLKKGLEICQRLKQDLHAEEISGSSDIAKVSIIGLGMRSHSGVAAKMFTALAKEGINIEMISTSEIKISCVISQKYAELAVRTLHDVFELDKASA